MNEIFAIFSVLSGMVIILGVVQYEMNLRPVEYMNAETGRKFKLTRVFGREVTVNV